jgi:hypothetical protein
MVLALYKVKLTACKAGLPGAYFFISQFVPLYPVYKTGLARHIPVNYNFPGIFKNIEEAYVDVN